MKRVFLVFAVVAGLFAATTTTASAQVLCHDDPTLHVAVPGVTTNLNVTLGGSNVFATSGKGSTSFGFTIGT